MRDCCVWIAAAGLVLTACTTDGFQHVPQEGWDSEDTICLRVADELIGGEARLVVRTDGTQKADSLTLTVDGRNITIGADLRLEHRGHVREHSATILLTDTLVRVSHRTCGKLHGVLDIGVVGL